MKNMPKKKKPLYRDATEIVIAFIVAWGFYQALSIITGSSQPVVSVVSRSMEHNEAFDAWWMKNEELYTKYDISKERFKNFPMPNGLYIGDILFIVASDTYNVGDIIVYHPRDPSCFFDLKSGQTIIHRIVKYGDIIQTKGDNWRNPIDRCDIEKSKIVGKALFVMPLLGYPRIALFAFGV